MAADAGMLREDFFAERGFLLAERRQVDRARLNPGIRKVCLQIIRNRLRFGPRYGHMRNHNSGLIPSVAHRIDRLLFSLEPAD